MAACSDDDTPTTPDPPDEPTYFYPASPDSAVAFYQQRFDARNAAGLDSLLAPGFQFFFEPSQADTFAIADQWGRTAEIASSRRLFEGETGQWEDGATHPAANQFPFGCMITPLVGSEWIAGKGKGTFVREFQVSLIINLVDFDVHFIGGTNRFTVVDASVSGGPEGETATGFAILTWEDLGFTDPGLAANSNGDAWPNAGLLPHGEASRSLHLSPWSFLKAVFRDPGLR